jgi:RNA polymerase sigma factor (sigma-70 family)
VHIGPLAPESVVRHAYMVARRILEPEAANDIAQETWIKYRTQLEREGPAWPERQARAWIWSVASNGARSHLRKKRPLCGLEPDQLDLAPDRLDPLERVVEREDEGEKKVLVWRILAGLPRRDRDLLVLRHLEGRSWSEVAAILDQNPRTLRSRYSRLLARLKNNPIPCQPATPEEGPNV